MSAQPSAAAAASAAPAAHVDPAYEFDAPVYCDFREADNPERDQWAGFGVHAEPAATDDANADVAADEEFMPIEAALSENAEPVAQEAAVEAAAAEEPATIEPAAEAVVAAVEPAVAIADESVVPAITAPADIIEPVIEVAAVEAAVEPIAAAMEEEVQAAEPVATENEAVASSPSAQSGSAVFAALRSSAPLLSPQAVNAAQGKHEAIDEQHKAVDEQVEALQESLRQEATPRIVNNDAAMEPSPVASAADESVDDSMPIRELAAQFAAVADSPQIIRAVQSTIVAPVGIAAAAAAAATPATSARKAAPSFLRPTAAAAARVAAVIEATTERAQTRRRTVQPFESRMSLAPAAAASATPKPNKKRSNPDALAELARPRTAVKLRHDVEEDSHRPGTARAKRSNSAARAGPKITVAQSPALCTKTRARTNPNLLSSEEEELRRIAKDSEEAARVMKHNAAMHEALAAQVSSEVTNLPLRSQAPLTHPEEFHFRTAALPRCKTSADAEASGSASRKQSNVHERQHLAMHITKPAPFTLATDRRPRRETAGIMSTEEKELAELAEMKPFKARPVNLAVLNSGGQMGVPRIQKAKPTEATSPQLATAARHKRKQGEDAEAAAASEKEANKSASKKPRRDVQPFQLATEIRGRKKADDANAKHEAEVAQEKAQHKFVARPLHAVSNPLPPAPVMPGITIAAAEPRCVAEHNAALARFEQQKAEEERAAAAAREFKARPNPFAASAAAAHIKEDGVTQAVKSSRPLTVAQTPQLSVSERAARRAELKAEQDAKDAALEAQKAECAAIAAEREAKELEALRRSMKPAATVLNKVILEKPTFVPQPSAAKLTVPESPMLNTKVRGNKAAKAARTALARMEEESASAHADDAENQQPEQPAEAQPEQQDSVVKALIFAPSDDDALAEPIA